MPDLVAAVATNGREGYVYAKDLESPTPSSPVEAARWQEEHTGDVDSIPVYLADGETVIGEFRLGGEVGSTCTSGWCPCTPYSSPS